MNAINRIRTMISDYRKQHYEQPSEMVVPGVLFVQAYHEGRNGMMKPKAVPEMPDEFYLLFGVRITPEPGSLDILRS